MKPDIYPMHGGAKFAYAALGVLLCLLIVTIPLGIWVFVKLARSRVEITSEGLVARGMRTVRMPFAEVSRAGICEMPIDANGFGGFLAKKKCGGDVGVNLCLLDRRGKTRQFIVSMYDQYQDILDRVESALGKPFETVCRGAFGLKWADEGE